MQLPWRSHGVDVALECTGKFTKRAEAAKHIEAGVKRVLVSAPADGADLTVVMGVNHEQLIPEHKVVSNASCTTNCLAPVAYVLHRGVGIERGYMTTIHAYAGHQTTIDTLHHDLRRCSGVVDDRDLHRCGEGGGPRIAGARRKARRHGNPGAHRKRVAD